MSTLGTNSTSAKSTALVNLPACGICFQPYNEAEHLPKVLSCGHTNCITCLSRWQSTCGHSKTITCMVCRIVTSGAITSIPNNYQLTDALAMMKLICIGVELKKQQEQWMAQFEEIARNICVVCDKVDGFDHLLRTGKRASTSLLSSWDSIKHQLFRTKKNNRPLNASNDSSHHGRESSSHEENTTAMEALALDDDDVSPLTERSLPVGASNDSSQHTSENSREATATMREASSHDNGDVDSLATWRLLYDGYTPSYCNQCNCFIPTGLNNFYTHIRGKRHQGVYTGRSVRTSYPRENQKTRSGYSRDHVSCLT